MNWAVANRKDAASLKTALQVNRELEKSSKSRGIHDKVRRRNSTYFGFTFVIISLNVCLKSSFFVYKYYGINCDILRKSAGLTWEISKAEVYEPDESWK